ncbi:MAG: methylmalonyl Co-A mutase-associated GTPase MeaB, partial [Pseudomonadota bacterium]
MSVIDVEDGAAALARVRAGGKAAMARALARLEARADEPETWALLDAAHREGRGHVLGLTGPPGVGKSSLAHRLIEGWRGRGLRVAVLAVDPSSRRTGGALLGDRTRIATDPEDAGVFVRSMAARDRLGGLAEITWPAAVLMRAAFDRVLVETVGVG